MRRNYVTFVGGPWDEDTVLLYDPKEVTKLNDLTFQDSEGKTVGYYRLVCVVRKHPFTGKQEVCAYNYKWCEADV